MATTIISPLTSGWIPTAVNLAIITAMDDELKPVLEAFQKWVRFDIDKFPYYHTEAEFGDLALSIIACSLWKYGQTPTTSAVFRLRDLKPKLIIMTGICAGWEGKDDIQLGDVLVGTKAFNPDEGKLSVKGMEFETDPFRPRPWLVSQLNNFKEDHNWFQNIKTPRPISLRYHAELLLCQMIDNTVPFSKNPGVWESIKAYEIDGLKARDWLRSKGYLTKADKLSKRGRDRQQEMRLQSSGELVPRPDREFPKVHDGAFATGQRVVAVESAFSEYAQRVRSIRAIEMEVASLYQAVEELEDVLYFAVKGVTDYATPQKDDQYRQYAAEASVHWTLAFLQTNRTVLRAISWEHNFDTNLPHQKELTSGQVVRIETNDNSGNIIVYNIIVYIGIPPGTLRHLNEHKTGKGKGL